MLKINNSDGEFKGVFHDEGDVIDFLIDEINEIEPIERFTFDDCSFKDKLDWLGYHITEDTVNCCECGQEIDDEFDEILAGYRCSYCRENQKMGKHRR